MTLPALLIVRDDASAYEARRMISHALTRTRPSNPMDDLPWDECCEASVFARAQYVLLHDWEDTYLPKDQPRVNTVTASRWLEVMAEHGTDGLWCHEGGPVSLDVHAEPGEPPELPLPIELQQRIHIWNQEFCAISFEGADLEAWFVGHDRRGMALVDEMRQVLEDTDGGWTVRFMPYAEAQHRRKRLTERRAHALILVEAYSTQRPTGRL